MNNGLDHFLSVLSLMGQ